MSLYIITTKTCTIPQKNRSPIQKVQELINSTCNKLGTFVQNRSERRGALSRESCVLSLDAVTLSESLFNNLTPRLGLKGHVGSLGELVHYY